MRIPENSICKMRSKGKSAQRSQLRVAMCKTGTSPPSDYPFYFMGAYIMSTTDIYYFLATY